MKEIIKLEESRFNKKIICESEFKNFLICIENFNIDTRELNELEEKLYNIICKDDTDRKWVLYKNFQKVTENIVNEMLYTDIKLLRNEPTWVSINMDSLYNIKLDHIKLNDDVLKEILPKSKENMRNKIINCNIIITTLFRYDNIFLHNRLKDDIDFELKEKIRYTKGYIVCIKPETVKKMKEYEYYRKTITDNKIEIKKIKKNMLVEEYLNNNYYTNPIWVKNNDITEINVNNIKILNNNLKEEIYVDEFIKNINFLNSIELGINRNTLNKIYSFIEKEIDINDLYITKNLLIGNIYKINEKNDSISIGEDIENIDFQKLANSASMLEIIKKQINRYEVFYINNAYDSRMRIYAQTWPVNYQLNHIIRASILINKKNKLKDILIKFKKNKIVKENYLKCDDSLINKISKETKQNLNKFIKDNMNWGGNKEYKKECLIMLMYRLSPNEIKNINEKINFSINNFNWFIKTKIEENWKEIQSKIKVKKNKIPYIFSLQECFLKVIKDDFSETYWLDASSNAIQLISLRMGCKNEKLLKLANIIDNDTEYENIYDYVTKKIKEKDHKEILEKINKKINNEELNSLRDKEDSKYLIMPACYGMGKYKNRINIEEKLNKNKIWGRLDKKEKNMISDYFWDSTFSILREIDFNLEEYKKICNELKNYDMFMWKNDVGLVVAPINIIKSKRQELLKKLNELKMKKNQTIEKNKIENKIIEIKKEIKKDDKMFWKRTMIKVNKNNEEKNIYIRIPNNEKRLDKRMTLQALTPNTIHSYDASIMFLCIQICSEIGIEILVIHDCIGCQLIHAPIVKKIFKIVNIEILKRNIEIKPFPIKNFNIEKEELEKIKKNILESTNFFR